MSIVDARTAMVDNQIRPADVVDYRILAAFLNTKRELFVPENKAKQAYGEYEIEFAPGRAMMTPRSFAKLTQLADPKPHEEVLLIGAALGYEAAILSQLSSSVIAVGAAASTVKTAQQSLSNAGFDNAVVIKGPFEKSAEKSGPYDLIVFNGAVQEISSKYAQFIKDSGRIVAIFEEDNVFTAKTLYKNGDRLFERSHFQASAPPLPGFEKKAVFAF